MKSLKIILVLIFAAALISCGNSKLDEERQKRIEDSLLEIERNNALNNADKLLRESDSIPVHPSDSQQH